MIPIAGEILFDGNVGSWERLMLPDYSRTLAVAVSSEAVLKWSRDDTNPPTDDSGGLVVTPHSNPLRLGARDGRFLWARAQTGSIRLSVAVVRSFIPA